MSKIFITGGNGFIGTHSANLLLAVGHDVYIYDKKGHNNILDFNRLRHVMSGFRPDAVLHLAANSSLQKSVESPVYDATNNIIGTLNVIEAMKKSNCKRLVFASSTSIYGPKAVSPYRETYQPDPACPYGISKLACEMYIELSGLDYANLRYANVYGPGQKPLGESILIARALGHTVNRDEFWVNGDGNQIRDWVYVGDVAKANLLALTNIGNGSYNVGSGDGSSVNYVVDTLKEILKYEGEIEHRPTISWEPISAVLNPNKIWFEMGWRAETSLKDGLKETVKAWLENAAN